jgi:glutaredoxin
VNRRWLVLAWFLVFASLATLGGCKRKSAAASEAPDAPPFAVRDDSEGLLLSWIDSKGDFHTEMHVPDVPLEGRDAVKVVDQNHLEGTHAGRVFVADLRTPRADGSYPVSVMTMADFEAIALARRKANGPTLASAADSASSGAAAAGDPNGPSAARPGTVSPAVIIYGADWCGACHDAAAYLRRKGVAFVEKNIEKDAGAAREMRDKLARSGMHGGSIPVIDVRGKVMVGFNARAIDDALGRAL